MNDNSAILLKARQCLNLEIEAIQLTAASLDDSFADIVRLISKTLDEGHKFIFTGVGKNVPICLKLTGTFNSTGVPSIFLDPNQALHGDLGLCSKGDLAFLISNSGETEDIVRVLPFLKRLGVFTVAITAKADCSLVNLADANLLYHYDKEACPLNLAPTASTTAALALGDALAMASLDLRGFSRDDFARFHPAGNLGKVLLLKVDDIMRRENQFAVAPQSASVKDALLAITKARCGSIALTEPGTGKLTGVFSDGDFRRASLAHPDILNHAVCDHMTKNPKSVCSGSLAVEALSIFESYRIDDLIVTNKNGEPIGLIDGQDMPKLRVL